MTLKQQAEHFVRAYTAGQHNLDLEYQELISLAEQKDIEITQLWQKCNIYKNRIDGLIQSIVALMFGGLFFLGLKVVAELLRQVNYFRP